MINWTATKEESATIAKIAQRAQDFANHASYTTTFMDIEATHCNGNPLDLEALLNAPDFDFSHDVFGIARHIDRETGKLGGFFVPRTSARQAVLPATMPWGNRGCR